MSKVTITMQGETAVLRLDNGATNAISSELVADMASALLQVRNNARGLVLAGNEKFFSIGLNLPELVQLDRTDITAYFTRLDRLIYDLFTLPIPSACAMTGHAIAGGSVLAISCDFRFAAEGKKLLGFNESTIGLPLPYLPDLILRQIIGDRAATEMVYHGQFIPSTKAAEIGLIDALLPLAEVEEQAVAKINTLAALPRTSFSIIKENRTDTVRRNYELYGQAKLAKMLDCWFEDSVLTLLKDAAQKF
jgi:enoyl-CoA hydratase/carnithine racemase